MGWAAAVQGAVGIGSALLGKHASDKATSAQTNAQQQALALQQQMWQQQQANNAPFMQYGQGAGGLGGLSALAGGDYSGFMNSPDYKAAIASQMNAMDHSAAANGRLFSGGYAKDLGDAQANTAASFLNNYRGSLQWGANLGQSAANNQAQMGQNYANQAGNAYSNIGNAQASGALTNANIYGQALGGLAGLAGQAFKSPTASSYGGGSNASQFGLPSPVANTSFYSPGWLQNNYGNG